MRPNKFTGEMHPSCFECYWYVEAYGCNYDPDTFENVETFRGQRPACSKFVLWSEDYYDNLPAEHAEHWKYVDGVIKDVHMCESNDTESLATEDNTPN